MADISILSRLLDGMNRNVTISENTLVLLSVKVGGASSNTELTKTILDNLVGLQNGSQVSYEEGVSGHAHDGRYFTETELGSSTASSGSDLVGDDSTYSNFTPAAATVKGALSGIDSALVVAGAKVKISENDTTSGYLEAKVVAENNKVSISTLNDGGDEDLQIGIVEANIVHQNLSGAGTNSHSAIDTHIGDSTIHLNEAAVQAIVGAMPVDSDQLDFSYNSENKTFTATVKATSITNDMLAGSIADGKLSVSYIKADGTRAFSGAQSMGGFKLTNMANGTASGDAVNYSQLSAVQSLIENFEWQKSVIDRLATPPGSPSEGDRYLIIATASGAWEGKEDYITEYTDSAWVFIEPAVGMMVGVDDESDGLYNYGGASWSKKYFESTTASTGLTKIGFDIRLDSSCAGVGLGFDAGVLSVNVDSSTLEIDTDTLRIKDLGVTTGKLAADSVDKTKVNADVAGNGLGQNVDGSLEVNVDDSTIEINTDALRVKDLGITTGKLAADSVDKTKVNADVAGNGLGQNVDGSLEVNVDGTTLEIDSDSLRVKAGGISNSQIAADAAIARSKVAAGTADHVIINDGSGNLSSEARLSLSRFVAPSATAAILVGNAGGTDFASVAMSGDATIASTGAITVAKATKDAVYQSFTAGENIAANDIVILSQATANQVLKADSDAIATCEGVIGVADETIESGNPIRIMIAGKHAVNGTFVEGGRGKRVYVSGTAGEGTSTAPSAGDSVVYVIGILADHSTKEIVLQPNLVGVN